MLRVRRAVGVEVLRAGLESALAVAHDHVSHPVSEHDVRTGQTGRARADDHHSDALGLLLDDAQGVQQRREHDDRRALLVS